MNNRCVGRAAADNEDVLIAERFFRLEETRNLNRACHSEYVLTAERFFSGVLHLHLLGVRGQDIFDFRSLGRISPPSPQPSPPGEGARPAGFRSSIAPYRVAIVSCRAQPLGDGRGVGHSVAGVQGRGGRSGDATALTCHQAAKVRRDGVKDAGETGARTAPPDARAGRAVSVTGCADFLGHKALLCVTPSGRRMDWWV